MVILKILLKYCSKTVPTGVLDAVFYIFNKCITSKTQLYSNFIVHRSQKNI